MTVGELIAKEMKEGKSPVTLPDGVLPPGAKEAFESLANMKKNIEEPLKKQLGAIRSIADIYGPQLQQMAEAHKMVLENYIVPEERIQNVRIINSENIRTGSNRKENNVVVASYILPNNANWESLSVQFLDGHIVNVSYSRMKSQKFDYKDMGFMNMKTNKPDLKWELLRAIAENSGALTKSNWNRKFGRNVKYELNERLKKFFGMDSNPISHYTKKGGYRATFSLTEVK